MPAFSPTTSSRRTAISRCLGLALSALAVAALAAPVAGAADAKYEGISADGRVAIFSTTDRLVPGDTDIRRDIYERSVDAGVGDYVTRQVSVGPVGGNNAFDALYYGVSQDGSKAFFSTIERLTSDDTDSALDVYMRDLVARTTIRVSRGDATCEPSCGNGSDPASPASGGGIAADGNTVFFSTDESLVPVVDTDASLDLYARDLAGGSTELVSRGDATCEPSGCGRAAIPAFFLGASDSGAKAFFSTAEGLVAADGDGVNDIYERDLGAGTTSLVSISLGNCPGNCDPSYGGASSDGTHVFFETNDRVSGLDTDSSQDVYDWSSGVATLASIGGTGEGNGEINALYAGSSPTGATVFFTTDERLDSTADTDTAQDIYARSGSSTELVSANDASCPACGNGNIPASLSGVPPQGSLVVFSTAEPLTGADTDVSQDIYVRDLAADTTTLASQADSTCVTPRCGNGAFDAKFSAASADGSYVLFVTDEPLVPGDRDANTDVYERTGGVTALVSTGAINGNGAFDAQLYGVSQDGSRDFFVTRERLAVDDDFLGEEDVFAHSAAGTLLVSVGNDPGLVLGPPPPVLRTTNPASPNASTTPSIVGQADGRRLDQGLRVLRLLGGAGRNRNGHATRQPGNPGRPSPPAPRRPSGRRPRRTASPPPARTRSPTSSRMPRRLPRIRGTGGGGGTGSGGSSTGGSTTGGGRAFLIPQTRITFAPGTKTRARRPVFRFTDATGQEGTTFRCKLDRGAWKSCGSPTKLKRLRWGKHTFRVTGVNGAGAQEPGVAKQAFKVVKG